MIKQAVFTACSHVLERLVPVSARAVRRAYDKLVLMDFNLHLIRKPALLDDGFWNADSSGVAYSDECCFHDYNVITLGLSVKSAGNFYHRFAESSSQGRLSSLGSPATGRTAPYPAVLALMVFTMLRRRRAD